MHIKHIKHIGKAEATGKLKEIYKHIELNFGLLAEPFVLHSIHTKLTAALWVFMLIETLYFTEN